MAPSVLIVEEQAHRLQGHLPNRFAELAEGFAAIGVHVDVLTSQGWAFEGSSRRTWTLLRFGAVARWIHSLTDPVIRSPKGRYPRPIGTIAAFLQQVVSIVEIRRARRRLRSPGGVVVLTHGLIPQFASIFLRGFPCIMHLFSPPRSRRSFRWVGRRLPKRTFPCFAVPDAAWVPLIEAEMPWARCEQLPLAGVRLPDPTTPEEARSRLGISSSQPVVLMIGSGHADQHPEAVTDALRCHPEWQLVVAGTACQRLGEALHGGWARQPVVFPGFVSHQQKEELLAAADIVALSFRAPYRRNSGTLMDAIAHLKPVIVSSGSIASDIVAARGLGRVFESGDPVDFMRQLRLIDIPATAAALTAARDDLGNPAVARRHMETLFGGRAAGAANRPLM